MLAAASLSGIAASASAAGASDVAAAVSEAAASAVTVRPGQSLNDLAIAVTQSHDKAVLARAARALFDANPQAFMKRDPSRLKIGATLKVPALDATGAGVVAASGASGVSAASAVAAASATGAPAVAHGASAAMAGSAAHAAGASGAMPAPPAGASATGEAVSPDHASPALAPADAAPAGASGPHVWSGAIQAAPSPVSDAVAPSSASSASAAPDHANAMPAEAAPQSRPSSLQQLLALKNRVLLELQKHGVGKPADDAGRASPASPAASDGGAAAAAAASAAQPAPQPVPQPARPVAVPAASDVAPQIDWRAASAVGGALVVLVWGFVWRKRRQARRAEPADVAPAHVPESSPAGPGSPHGAATTLTHDGGPADVQAAAEGAVAATSDVESSSRADVSKPAVDASSAVAAGVGASATASVDESTSSAATVGEGTSFAASVDERPSSAAVDVGTSSSASANEHAPADAATSTPAADDPGHVFPHDAIAALDSLDMPLPPRQSIDTLASAPPSVDDQIATNGLADPLPPIDGDVHASMPFAGQGTDQDPAAHPHPSDAHPAPQTTGFVADHAAGSSAPSPFPPLGAAQFGALKLDFDLDLPSAPDGAASTFTPEELARIARNKLDLAAEYVELGDLSGARTLLQEVVDANDDGTRDDARALLAKLADRT